MFSLIVISAVFWLQWRFRRNVPSTNSINDITCVDRTTWESMLRGNLLVLERTAARS